MLLACLLSNQENLVVFCEIKFLKSWLLSMFLHTSERKIREEIFNLIKTICLRVTINSDKKEKADNEKQLSETPSSLFLNLLLSFLSGTFTGRYLKITNLLEVESYPKTCSEYFSILATLIESNPNSSKLQWRDLVRKLVAMVTEHPVLETSANGEPDIIIMGLLNLSKYSLPLTSPLTFLKPARYSAETLVSRQTVDLDFSLKFSVTVFSGFPQRRTMGPYLLPNVKLRPLVNRP